MKKLLFIAATVAIAATSCSKVETVDINQQSMEFGVTTNSTTKATTSTVTNLSTFYATGWNHTNAWANTASDTAIAFMSNEEFSTNNSTTATPQNIASYYWLDGYTSFFAYSDSSINLTATTPTNSGSGFSYPTFEYTTKGETSSSLTETDDAYGAKSVADLEDLLIGSVMDQTSATNSGTVAFALDHALAKVSFTAIGENTAYEYVITGIRMNSLNNTGKFTYKTGDTTTGNVDGSWGSVSGDVDYVYSLASNTITIAANTTTVTNITENSGNSLTDDEFIVMPQTFAGYILVKYQVNYTSSSNSGEAWAVANLTSKTVDLAPGSNTTFKLVLPSEGGTSLEPADETNTDGTSTVTAMSFTVSVDNWSAATGTAAF